MSNRYRNHRDTSWRDDKDVILVLFIIIAALIASYYLGRMRATYEHSFAFCKALFGETPRHQECMEERPWER